jgi:hypothetical protein
MALDVSRMVTQGHLIHDDVKQFADLLTGVMTDQPVTITNRLALSGNLTFSADNTYDIGAAAASRPRYVYAATALVSAFVQNLSGDLSLWPSGNVNIGPAFSFQWVFVAGGNFHPAADNASDIGQVANRPRTVYAATSFIGPGAVPPGGASGQVLSKSGAGDYALAWSTPSAGGVTMPLTVPLTFSPDGTLDIGASGATRPRSLYLSSYVEQTEIAKPANPPAGQMRLYPKTDGNYYQLSPAGVETALGGQAAFTEEFLPANAATTVTLSRTPTALLVVARDGVTQSLTDGHYSLAGAVVTFTDAFNGAERVVITYAVGLLQAVSIPDASISGAKLILPVDIAGTFRSTNETDPVAGAGVEMMYQPAFTRGVVHAFDRSAGAYLDILLIGKSVQIATNGGGVLNLPNQSITTPMLANNSVHQVLADYVLPGAFTTTTVGSWVPSMTTPSLGCQGGRQRIEFNGIFTHTQAGANFYTGVGVDGVVGQALSYTTLGPAGTYVYISWVYYTSQPIGNHTFSVFVNNSNGGTLTMSNIINSYLHVTEERR